MKHILYIWLWVDPPQFLMTSYFRHDEIMWLVECRSSVECNVWFVPCVCSLMPCFYPLFSILTVIVQLAYGNPAAVLRHRTAPTKTEVIGQAGVTGQDQCCPHWLSTADRRNILFDPTCNHQYKCLRIVILSNNI